jgi:hypothetical protein
MLKSPVRIGVLGNDKVEHAVTVLDPLELFGEGGALASSGGELRTPAFFYKPGTQPEPMAAVQKVIKDAVFSPFNRVEKSALCDAWDSAGKPQDCFLIVSPEYNHSVPPALAGLMGTFGGSNYTLKPSAIVTYSPGPWGGMRAAVALRPFLSELGCLPVSKLTGYPDAGELFNEDGAPRRPACCVTNLCTAKPRD